MYMQARPPVTFYPIQRKKPCLAAAGVPGTYPAGLSRLIPLIIQDKTFVCDNAITTRLD